MKKSILIYASSLLLFNCSIDESLTETETELNSTNSSLLIDNNFRLKMAASDGSAGSNNGVNVYTQYANSGSNGWSDWCQDSDGLRPDYLSIGFANVSANYNGNDFRLWIQFADCSGACGTGVAVSTPWASEGGGWTDWAGDSNFYEFDVFRMKIETRNRDVNISKFRIGIQAAKKYVESTKVASGTGSQNYTNFSDDGAGWTGWTTDSNKNNPDAVRINLDVAEL